MAYGRVHRDHRWYRLVAPYSRISTGFRIIIRVGSYSAVLKHLLARMCRGHESEFAVLIYWLAGVVLTWPRKEVEESSKARAKCPCFTSGDASAALTCPPTVLRCQLLIWCCNEKREALEREQVSADAGRGRLVHLHRSPYESRYAPSISGPRARVSGYIGRVPGRIERRP
eukprot:3670474-Rhodomonas_salina.3